MDPATGTETIQDLQHEGNNNMNGSVEPKTATEAVGESEVEKYEDAPNQQPDRDATKTLKHLLETENTTKMLADNAIKALPPYPEAYADGTPMAYRNLLEAELGIDYQRVKYRLVWNDGVAAEDRHPVKWLVVFEPEDNPATPENESQTAVEIVKVVEWSGQDGQSEPHEINPETERPGKDGRCFLLPVEFKTYPDTEAGPDKPHLRNLETRQDEEGFYGDRRKCVAHVWQDQWIDLIDYLDGADDPNLRELYEDNLDWRSNGHAVNHELNWVGEPAEDDITVYLIEVLPKGGNDVIDSLYLTVVPRSTQQSFDAWYNSEKADTAWLQELPPVFNRIETTPEPDGYLPRPDQNFNPYFYGVPHEINTRFHPDGYYEQRSYKTPGGHGHQVCFDDGGALIESGVSAGSADKAAPFPANLNPLPHVEADVKTFLWALHLDGNPTRQDGTNLTSPIMHEGMCAGRYFEVRPALPNGKPRLEPGATP